MGANKWMKVTMGFMMALMLISLFLIFRAQYKIHEVEKKLGTTLKKDSLPVE